MTTTAIDRNEAFRTERLGQIANLQAIYAGQVAAANQARADFQARIDSGKLADLGNGRYRVTDPDSWDNGEVWQQRATILGTLVLPVSNLDMSTGDAALYSRVPAWHALGTIVPEGVTSIAEVLKLANIGFRVERRPVEFRIPLLGEDGTPLVIDGIPQLGEPIMVADKFVNYRADNGAPLGVVGKGYTIVQNFEACAFLQELIDRFDVPFESAGALYNGSKIFVSMRLPKDVAVNIDGVIDEIFPFVVLINTHDGEGSIQVVVTPWRPVCGNTERMAVRDAHTRWTVRHTRNALQRIEEARRTLKLSVNYFEHFQAEEQQLAETAMNIGQFHSLVEHLWEPPKDDDEQAERDSVRAVRTARESFDARLAVLDELWAENTERLGENAYAAERVITEFSDWRSEIKPRGLLKGKFAAARATAMLEGNRDELKGKAHKRLLQLVGGGTERR